MNRIKELRQERGLSQAQLAKLAGFTQQFISDLENGRTKFPSLPNGIRIARALGVAPEELIGPKAEAASNGWTRDADAALVGAA